MDYEGFLEEANALWELFTTGKRRKAKDMPTIQALGPLGSDPNQTQKEVEIDLLTRTLKSLQEKPLWRGTRVNFKHIPTWEKNF